MSRRDNLVHIENGILIALDQIQFIIYQPDNEIDIKFKNNDRMLLIKSVIDFNRVKEKMKIAIEERLERLNENYSFVVNIEDNSDEIILDNKIFKLNEILYVTNVIKEDEKIESKILTKDLTLHEINDTDKIVDLLETRRETDKNKDDLIPIDFNLLVSFGDIKSYEILSDKIEITFKSSETILEINISNNIVKNLSRLRINCLNYSF